MPLIFIVCEAEGAGYRPGAGERADNGEEAAAQIDIGLNIGCQPRSESILHTPGQCYKIQVKHY